MKQTVYELRPIDQTLSKGLFISAEEAWRYVGIDNRYLYVVIAVKKNVVFIVVQLGEHDDGGDTIDTVFSNYVSALAYAAKKYRNDYDYEIYVREVRS